MRHGGDTHAESVDSSSHSSSSGEDVESDSVESVSSSSEEEEEESTGDRDLQEHLQRLLAAQEGAGEAPPDPKGLQEDAATRTAQAPEVPVDAAQKGANHQQQTTNNYQEAPSWSPVVFDNRAADLAPATADAVGTPELDPRGCADDGDGTEPPDEEEDEEQTSSTSSEADDYGALLSELDLEAPLALSRELLFASLLARMGPEEPPLQPATQVEQHQVLPDQTLTGEQSAVHVEQHQVPTDPCWLAEEFPTDSVDQQGLQQQQQQHTPQLEMQHAWQLALQPTFQPELQPTLQPALQRILLSPAQPEPRHLLSNGVQQQPLVQSQLPSNNEQPFARNSEEQDEQGLSLADEECQAEQLALPVDMGPDPGAEQLALPVDVGPDPALAGASSRAARRKAAAALPAELTPRLLCLRDLANASLEELGVTYTEFVEQLYGRALAAGRSLVPRNRVSFQVSVPVTLKRSRPLARAPSFPESRALAAPARLVVLDEAEDDDAPHCQPEQEEDADPADPYEHPAAPLALLRAYSLQGRWTGIRNGCVVFEDDRVQYPAATLTPIREQEEGGALLSLASLWLLAAMRGRYQEAASHRILQDHGAVRIASYHMPHLLPFLMGRTKECRLLVTPEKLASVPAPVATRLPPLRKRSSSRPPLTALELRHLPERERDVQEVNAQRLGETLRSTKNVPATIETRPANSSAPMTAVKSGSFWQPPMTTSKPIKAV